MQRRGRSVGEGWSSALGIATKTAVSYLVLTGLFAGGVGGCTGQVRGVGQVGDGGQVRDGSPWYRDASSDGHQTVDSGWGRDAGGLWDAGQTVDAARVDAATVVDGGSGGVEPPLGGSSGGSGGATAPNGIQTSGNGVQFVLIVPSSYSPSTPNRFMVVYSGTERAGTMAQNLVGVRSYVGLEDVIFAVLDGVDYNGDGQAGASVMDWVRAHYNIDNDRTFLFSESAGTTAGLQLGLSLRQSYFAAYWANDVNASASPAKTAAQLGFAPWGNAGPGGDFADANAIVAGMRSAGYRLPADAPYSGAGADQHGSTEQFVNALRFFDGKSRN